MGGEMYRAGSPSPGARLLAVASLLASGGTVADIGCDHGKLSVYLVQAGIANRVIAVDNRPMPLAKAKALVKQTRTKDRVDCRLGDGLQPLQPKEADEIVIAGMSGETMVQILEKAPWIRDEKIGLVFVPARKIDYLRRYLCEQGFRIEQELPVEEKRRYYTVVAARYEGKPQEQSPLFYQVGLVPDTKSPAAKGVLESTLGHLKKYARGVEDAGEEKILYSLIGEIEQCLLLQR